MNKASISKAGLQHLARRRRTLFFGLTLTTALAATMLMLHILSANRLLPLELLSLPLFFVLFTWIAGSFWTTVAGFCVRLRGGEPPLLSSTPVEQTLQQRVAVLMPIYNEDTAQVFSRLESIWRSLQERSQRDAFDLFVLSDTRHADLAALERQAWQTLVERHAAHGRIFYRRRAENTDRKTGNIADFVRRWGGAYESMVILDADSVMSGATLVTLATLMQAHPDAGIIQTLPMPLGRHTLFARVQQFASRLHGPLLASGVAYWQLGECNYWGHNAILRIRPFAKHCALPRLPGEAPLGGEILSHDFVEAAFMRRAGYKVWMVPDLGGSWEEVPSNVIDYAARDRRWTQGNLQHLGVLPLHGLHWLSRMHFVTGILSYVSSLLWLTLLMLASLVICQMAIQGHQYFPANEYTLFPLWRQDRSLEIYSLVGLTTIVLLAPKLLAFLLVLRDHVTCRGFGGPRRLLASLFGEQLFSILLAPAMMLFHSTFVVTTLVGKPVSWDAQARDDRELSWGEAYRRHRWHMALGILWGGVILALSPGFIWWVLPVLAGLIASAALSVWSSRVVCGATARRWGLFLTPEEITPPREIAERRVWDLTAKPASLVQSNRSSVPLELAPLTMKAATPRYVRLGRKSATWIQVEE